MFFVTSRVVSDSKIEHVMWQNKEDVVKKHQEFTMGANRAQGPRVFTSKSQTLSPQQGGPGAPRSPWGAQGSVPNHGTFQCQQTWSILVNLGQAGPRLPSEQPAAAMVAISGLTSQMPTSGN